MKINVPVEIDQMQYSGHFLCVYVFFGHSFQLNELLFIMFNVNNKLPSIVLMKMNLVQKLLFTFITMHVAVKLRTYFVFKTKTKNDYFQTKAVQAIDS